jgi:hypothetical protein
MGSPSTRIGTHGYPRCRIGLQGALLHTCRLCMPFAPTDCSPSGLEFYVIIFITTHWLKHKRTIHAGVNQIGLAVT